MALCLNEILVLILFARRAITQGVNGSCESGVLLYRAELKMSIYGMFLVGAEDPGDDGGCAIA